jgi:hypothetical protein
MKPRLLLALILVLAASVAPATVAPRYLLQAVTTTGPGAAFEVPASSAAENEPVDVNHGVFFSVAGTPPIEAVIGIEVSNDGTTWNYLMGSITYGYGPVCIGTTGATCPVTALNVGGATTYIGSGTPGATSFDIRADIPFAYVRANVYQVGSGTSVTATIYP